MQTNHLIKVVKLCPVSFLLLKLFKLKLLLLLRKLAIKINMIFKIFTELLDFTSQKKSLQIYCEYWLYHPALLVRY